MYGLDYVGLLPFNVYGPRMDVHGVYTEVLVRWMERIAAGQPLSPSQLDYLKAEEVHEEHDTVTYLLVKLDTQITAALDALKAIDETTLTQFRGVGRQQLPSTVLGLLFHAAEHTMRHTGQLLVTVQILNVE